MYEKTECLTETVLEGKPSDRPWEGCINSVVYRVPRGVPVSIPRFLAEHIEKTEAERARAEKTASRISAAANRLNRS